MSTPELAQIELLARVDELVDGLSQWAEPDSPWEPMNRCRALIRRLLARVETLRIRLEAPLVVATFGGSGTGKSMLVNALVGRECTKTGRERPTTRRPVLIAHPEIDLEALGLPLDDFEFVRVDSPMVRDIVMIDCPDPDTTEAETPESNLRRLHQLLPYCDVLIYTSTQQKYRSARVGEELGQAATGCRLIFVQTHADADDDIRDDWRKYLSEHYEVPETFFVDSVRALNEQLAQQRPTGEFARLQDLLGTQLGASQRIQIRRANLTDLIHAAIERCRSEFAGQQAAVEQLEAALEEQRAKLTATMTRELRDELLVSRNLWERRLISSVTQIWGFSPFSSVLRFYNGMGSLIASLGLYRARSSAQMALIGTLQGARWLKSRRQEKVTESQLERISVFGLDDETLRESQFVISGYVRSARLDPELAGPTSLDELRHEATRMEDRFLGDAGRRIDRIIDGLAERNSRFFVHALYELLFGAYILFVLYRVGKNFFYDTFLAELISAPSGELATLLTLDFYIAAGIFFALWSGLLVMAFTGRLRRGLRTNVEKLARELAQNRVSRGLFPRLERSCREIELARTKLNALTDRTDELRSRVGASAVLGAPLSAANGPLVRPDAAAQ
jgi:hypothetical protein